ncbi:MAG: phosphoribosyl-AMP cyclohydrolase [Aestuariivirgaceae bacterium]
MRTRTEPFAAQSDVADIEEGSEFAPKFGGDGLIPAIACDARSGAVLMLAYMNELALRKTIETGEAHYWSRSRGALWRKGETSGETQRVEALLTDCDQDAIILHVQVGGRGATCHTGRHSCFYRRLNDVGTGQATGKLTYVNEKRLFDPANVYGRGKESSGD